MSNKLEKWLGLEKYSPFVKKYFELSNAYSSLYLCAVIICIELWMIISVIVNILVGSKARTALWIIQHISAYVVLLLCAVLILIYSVRTVKGRNTNHKVGITLRSLFSFIALIFGIYISYLDYAKAEQVLAFITMEVFILCLISWRPFVSFLISASSFIIFFLLCNRVSPATYATKVNLFTAWVAIFMSAVCTYHLRRRKAISEERLESVNNALLRVSITDEMTGVPNMYFFRTKARELLQNPKTDFSNLIFLFLDIENFKNYNEKYGFEEANLFLHNIAMQIKDVFSDDIIARVSDDHFIILTKSPDFQERLRIIREKIQDADSEIHMGLKVGGYRPQDISCAPILACDRARYACMSIKKHYDQDFCEYECQMNDEFYKKQYIINNFATAIESGYIKPYYQPVVWAENGKLCGVEALARWEDPRYGLLPPSSFVSVLEEYRQIYLLDMCILETVCKDLRYCYENNLPIIPVSINFSRLDFELSEDICAEVTRCIKKYNISKDDLHIEITESALNEGNDTLQNIMSKFRREGFALWLDDFGSGYSGLNVLKEYDFDMMKIDMKFLSNFSSNEKARPILSSIVQLAKNVNMQTLTEGVETKEEYEFLKSIGCQRLQGYLFGKPMPRDSIIQKVKDGTYDCSTLKTSSKW